MVNRLLALQIPQYWDVIKFCAAKVTEIDIAQPRSYFVRLLCKLLTNKAQCWIRLSDDRTTINSLMITEVLLNKDTGERYFGVSCAYSFRTASIEVWAEDWEAGKQFAEGEGCAYMFMTSSVKRVWEVAEALGCKEVFRAFALDLGRRP